MTWALTLGRLIDEVADFNKTPSGEPEKLDECAACHTAIQPSTAIGKGPGVTVTLSTKDGPQTIRLHEICFQRQNQAANQVQQQNISRLFAALVWIHGGTARVMDSDVEKAFETCKGSVNIRKDASGAWNISLGEEKRIQIASVQELRSLKK